MVYAAPRPDSLHWWDLFAFIIPATSFLELEVVGRLFVSDLVLLILLPLLLLFRGVAPLRQRFTLMFLGFWLLWLIGLIASDLYGGTPFEDYIRGWAKVALTGIYFVALYLMLDGRPRRIVLFAIGLIISWSLIPLFSEQSSPFSGTWKFTYGPIATWAAVLVAFLLGLRRGGAVVILVAVGVANFVLGARAMGGISMLAAIYLALAGMWGPLMPARSWRTGAIVVLLSVFGWGVYEGYQVLAESGILGERARQHNMEQSEGEFGLLIGGRSEIVVASRAIADSPIIGHGSWARDCGYAEMLAPLLNEFGYSSYRYNPYQDCLIPTHSHLFGAWTEAGILGALFWFWVLVLIALTLHRNLALFHRLTPLVVFTAILFAWDILFSPFGGERRFINPYIICLLIFSLGWVGGESDTERRGR